MAIYKACRLQIYDVYKYKNPASYFKTIKGYHRDDANKIARTINGACKIYDKFNKILVNLMIHCPFVDIRKLSFEQLSLAFDPNWCLMYNEVLRGKFRGNQTDYTEGFMDFINTLFFYKKLPQHPALKVS